MPSIGYTTFYWRDQLCCVAIQLFPDQTSTCSWNRYTFDDAVCSCFFAAACVALGFLCVYKALVVSLSTHNHRCKHTTLILCTTLASVLFGSTCDVSDHRCWYLEKRKQQHSFQCKELVRQSCVVVVLVFACLASLRTISKGRLPECGVVLCGALTPPKQRQRGVRACPVYWQCTEEGVVPVCATGPTVSGHMHHPARL